MGKAPGFAHLKAYIARYWNTTALSEIYWNDEGYYIVKFRNAQDKDDIPCSGPYTMNGMPLCLKKQSYTFDFQKEMPTTLPLWVRLYNLPLDCWGPRTSSKIAS